MLTVANISIFAGESKIFGDTVSQAAGTSFIGKTGLGFGLTDTAAIAITLSVSGQIVDTFVVDVARVNQLNDQKTSFERRGDIITGTSKDRAVNAVSGYTINPGIYFASGPSTPISLPSTGETNS